MNRFLRLKHWQVFIYLVFIPVFFPDNETGTYFSVIWGFLLTVWLLKANEELYLRLDKKPEVSLKLLQANLIISFLYMSIISLFTEGYSISSDKDNYAEYGWKMWLYIPFTFYILFSYLYALHFTAYSIQKLDKKIFGKTTEYSSLLAALFFLPIGIWWLQPKINRILETPVPGEAASDDHITLI